MPKHQFSERIIKETKDAIKQFGRYSFDDKGSDEVMDLDKLERDFKKLSHADKIQVAKDLKKKADATVVLGDILSQLEGHGSITESQLTEIAKAGSQDLQESLDIYEDESSMKKPVLILAVKSAEDVFGNLFDQGPLKKGKK